MRAKGGRRCLSLCHSAHANGRVGSQVSDADGTSSILGLVGGRSAHGAREAPCSGAVNCGPTGSNKTSWLLEHFFLRAATNHVGQGFVGQPQWATW